MEAGNVTLIAEDGQQTNAHHDGASREPASREAASDASVPMPLRAKAKDVPSRHRSASEAANLSEDKLLQAFSGHGEPARSRKRSRRHIGVTVGEAKIQRFARRRRFYFQSLENFVLAESTFLWCRPTCYSG